MPDEQRRCPFCDEEIRPNAIKCKHCQAMLDGSMPHPDPTPAPDRTSSSGMVPEWVAGTARIPKGTEIQNYRIERMIGKGGMGEIYLAHHTYTEQKVALKAVSPALMADRNSRRRFLEEGRVMARMKHENVVRLHNFFEEKGRFFLAMEYVRGEALEGILARQNGEGKRLTIDWIVQVAVGIVAGVAHAHASDPVVVHRDIKPANVMLDTTRRVYVTDFGIAKAVGREQLTQTLGVVGTYEYMSPEQVIGQPVSPASDVYSLGITLYEMIAGSVPFPQDTDTGINVMNAHRETPPPPIAARRPNCPVWLANVVHKALGKDPSDRYADAGEMLAAMEAGGAEPSPRTSVPQPAPAAPSPPHQPTPARPAAVVDGARAIQDISVPDKDDAAPSLPPPVPYVNDDDLRPTGLSRGLKALIVVGIVVALVVALVYAFGGGGKKESDVSTSIEDAGQPGRLSPTTLKVLRAFGEVPTKASPLEVRVYVSHTLPDTITGEWEQDLVIRGVAQKFRDMLDEYRYHMEGRMKIVEVTNDIENLAEEAGLQPFVAKEDMVNEEGTEVPRYFLGCTFHWEGKVEVYEKAVEPAFFEFEITKRLLRLKDRVQHGRKVLHLTRAADQIWDAISECSDSIAAFDVKEDEKQGMSGNEGTVRPIENMDQEVAALAKNRNRVIEKCQAVGKLWGSTALQYNGQHKHFDAFVMGTGTDGNIGGAGGFVQVIKRLDEALAADPPNVQQVIECKNLLVALKTDAQKFRDMLNRAAGQRRIGFVCDHGEFCPFPADKPVIDPKIAGTMGQQNPIHQRFLEVALQLQDQVNETMAGIGTGLFTDRDFDVVRVDAAKPIFEDIGALVIFAAHEKISAREMYEIDQYLMRGGSLLVLVDNYNVFLASFSEAAIKKMGPFNPNPKFTNDFFAIEDTGGNVAELLAPYGIVVNDDLVIDPYDNGKVTLPHSVQRGKTVVKGTKDFDYPMLVRSREFDRTNAMVRNLAGLTLPFASTLEFAPQEGQEVEVSHLVKSGPHAIALTDPTSLAVRKVINEEGQEIDEMLKLVPPDLMAQATTLEPNGPHTLAMVVAGDFVSAFKGKDAPPKPEPETSAQAEEPPEEGKAPVRVDSGTGRILVVGNSLGIVPLSLEGVFKDVGVSQITQGEILVPQVRLENWKIKLNQLRQGFPENVPALYDMLDWAAWYHVLDEIPCG